MQLNYLTSAVQGVNFANDVADFFLTPLRELVDGYQFEVSYGWDAYDCYGPIRDVREVSDRVDCFAQDKFFALLLVATVVPTLIGVAFKILAAIGGAFDEYERVERYMLNHPLKGLGGGGIRGGIDPVDDRRHQPQGRGVGGIDPADDRRHQPQGRAVGQVYQLGEEHYCLDLKGIALTPAEVEKSEALDEQVAQQLYPLDRLATEWDNLAWMDDNKRRRVGNYDDIRRLLAGIPGQVANKAGYWAIKGGVNDGSSRDEVQKQMTQELRGILQAFDSGASQIMKIEALVRLAEAARVCTPTLIDEAHKVHMRMTSRGIEDTILVLIQTLKENIVLSMVNGGGSWHSINPVRHRYGVALGLMVGSMKADSAWSEHDRPMRLSAFLQVYTVQAVVSYVQDELNKFNLSDEIVMYLMQNHAAVKSGEVSPREAFFLPVPKAVFTRWMDDERNAKQKGQYEEAVGILAKANEEIVAAQEELVQLGDDGDADAKAAAQKRLEDAQSKQELYVDVPKQFEIALRTEINEAGVMAMLECLGIVRRGDQQVTARMLGFNGWED